MTDDPQIDHGPEDDYVPEDDTVIGVWFRRSLLAAAVIAVVAVVVLLIGRGGRQPAPERPIETSAPEAVVQAAAPPAVRFVDVTAESGIDFVHYNGAYGDKLLPETMGGGVAFLDFDADGDPDLLFVNSSQWPHHDYGEPPPTMALYENDGSGRFDDVTAGSGLDVSFYGMGAAIADYDGDGHVDVFLTAVGENRLFRNRGGGGGPRFEDVTGRAGVAGDGGEWSTSAAFFDADNDGDLDLFVANYVRWTQEIDFELDFRLTGVGRAYGPPQSYQGTFPYLYRNDGEGRSGAPGFTDISEASGIRIENPATGVPVAKSLGLAPIDFDGDGRMDVLVANDTVQNYLLRNVGMGDGGVVRFEDEGELVGVAYDRAGSATGAMGIDAGYYRNDRNLGFLIGNFANEMTSVYVTQDDPGIFVDEAIGEGIGAPSRLMLSFGVLLFDYDLDGRLDLLQTNGHLEDEIESVDPSQRYRQPGQLFWNAGYEHGFVPVPPEAAGDLAEPIVGRGSAYADVDGDGDLDLVLTQVAGRPLLLRNDQDLGHHWLRVELTGRAPNLDAIGARVEVTAGGFTQRRQVMPTRSYMSQVERTLTFGLGEVAAVDKVEVFWPDGSRQVVDVGEVDRVYRFEHGG
ncbi:MAG: CRTAC1 family protein [Thermoanaerobaculia bacterium]